jgi:hypothetical protein
MFGDLSSMSARSRHRRQEHQFSVNFVLRSQEKSRFP